MKYALGAAFLIVLAIGLGSTFFSGRSNTTATQPQVEAAEADTNKTLPNLRRLALRPVHISQPGAFNPEQKPGAAAPANAMEKLPQSCLASDALKEIVENDLESLVLNAKASATSSQDCLLALGSPKECFANPNQKDEYHLCSNNLAIARAKLIDAMTAETPVSALEPGALANKIIARIYSSEKNMDQQSAELFALSDQFVSNDIENLEAHNLRSYFSFQVLKDKDDADVLAKSNESSDVLRRSSESKLVTLGYLQQFALEILNFARSNTPESLANADAIAEQFMVEYPDDAKGLIMKSVVFGYKDELSACKEWTEKALAKGGPTQSGYEEYKEIVKSIEKGSFDRKMLGVRISSSESFIPEKILR